MVKLKTPEEIEIMKTGGEKLRNGVAELTPRITEGVSTNDIDKWAEELIKGQGGESSFKRVPGYHWTICCPINEQVVHTPPSTRKLKDGDVFTLDIGMYYKGFHTDFAKSWVIGKPKSPEYISFLETGKDILTRALSQIRTEKYLGEISDFIHEEITKRHYFILRELTGHGIGRDLHEDPSVPNYLDRPVQKTMKIVPGLVVAIEVIYSMGTEEIAYEKDSEWSIRTQDNSMSACFEHTIAVTDTNTIILT